MKKDSFKVIFRGVRGSFPVPKRQFLGFGGNTSCVEINVGGHIIILDAGSGIVDVGDTLIENYISSSVAKSKRSIAPSTIFLSHQHLDHLLGLAFFKPLHVKKAKVSIYGQSQDSLNKNISESIFGKTFPLELGEVACDLSINNLTSNQAVLFRENSQPILVENTYIPAENEVFVTFYHSYVHPKEGVTIYKVEYNKKSLVYATDKECYMGGDVKFINFARNCDVLIHDTQYTTEDYASSNNPKQGFGHSTYDMAIDIMKKTNAKNLICFHYDPSYDDTKLTRIKDYYTSDYKNVFMSYEGFEFNLI